MPFDYVIDPASLLYQPERIQAVNTYSVSSDVWSLGLSLVEVGGGKYPYENDNMFAQLKAIIDEEPPKLPNNFSEEAHSFISDWYVPLPISLSVPSLVHVLS